MSKTETVLIVEEHEDEDDRVCDKDDIDNWKPVYLTDTTEHRVLFTDFDILLDNEASISIFRNPRLLGPIHDAVKPITIKGVQSSATGILVPKEGEFRDLGKVYYSSKASANILSFATQVDAVSTITYDATHDYFLMTPATGNTTYKFERKHSGGSMGKFYACDTRTPKPNHHYAVLQTVHNHPNDHMNKRETKKAAEARDLLARLAFPPTSAAAQIVETGANFNVTRQDFIAADTVWGPSIASIKGKSTWHPPRTADQTICQRHYNNPLQTLSVDILSADKIPILIGVAYPLDLTLASGLTVNGSLSRSCAAMKSGIQSSITRLPYSPHNDRRRRSTWQIDSRS